MKQELFDKALSTMVLGKDLSAIVLLLAFLYVCLSVVAGVEGLPVRSIGKSLTVSGSLSSDLLIMHGWEGWLRLFSEGWALVPPRFLHFSHFSCLASVYLFVDGVEACAFQPI